MSQQPPQYYQQPPQSPQWNQQQRTQQAAQHSPFRSFTAWFVLGPLLGVSIGYAVHTPPASSAPVTTSQSTQVVTQNNPTQAPAQPTALQNSVGSHATSGIWQLTINSAKTSTGTEFDTPKAVK